ncbi:hypothetical protein B1R94_25885 [Mycolicibacterium litorale]|nr:hypothetical protein B1R94_25885 [Mycolicibacterium litorale]
MPQRNGLRAWLQRLDNFGMCDPDNNEGHPEDICTICEHPIADHPGRERFGIGDGSARWPHRRRALLQIAFQP